MKLLSETPSLFFLCIFLSFSSPSFLSFFSFSSSYFFFSFLSFSFFLSFFFFIFVFFFLSSVFFFLFFVFKFCSSLENIIFLLNTQAAFLSQENAAPTCTIFSLCNFISFSLILGNKNKNCVSHSSSIL